MWFHFHFYSTFHLIDNFHIPIVLGTSYDSSLQIGFHLAGTPIVWFFDSDNTNVTPLIVGNCNCNIPSANLVDVPTLVCSN